MIAQSQAILVSPQGRDINMVTDMKSKKKMRKKRVSDANEKVPLVKVKHVDNLPDLKRLLYRNKPGRRVSQE
jgi:hypothetical protein